MTRPVCWVLIAFAAACDGGSKGSAPPVAGTRVGLQPAFTLAGVGVSIAGAVSFEDLGAVASSPPRGIDGVMRHVYGPGSDLSVRFFIPAAVYHGPATYTCGAEQGKLPQNYAYCSLTVVHRASDTISATWTTEGAPTGVYGPFSGCDIVVAQDEATVKSGTMSCTPPFATGTSGHPDAGKALTVSGSWKYQIL